MPKTKYIESETLELKSTLSEKEEILETISAFSNTKGGKIHIGINQSGKIIGVDIGSNTLENLGLTWDKFNKIVLSLSQVCPKTVPSYAFAMILLFVQKTVDVLTLMNSLMQTNRTRFRNNILKPIINEGFVNYTIPDKPNSPKQKYVITEKGKQILNSLQLSEKSK